jgi:hypothetical protein
VNVETADAFATLLFEEAKAFLEKYRSHREEGTAVAYLHAALLLGYCALEAHINNVAADFADRPELTILEQSILQERDVTLKGGQFELTNMLKMFRLEDRFEFLYRRFQDQPLNKTKSWWGLLKAGLDLRNGITHPRTPRIVTEKEVSDSLNAVLEAIDVLFQAVYGRPYPGKGRRLDSLLEF